MSQPVLALPGPQYAYDHSRGLSICGENVIVLEEGGQGRGTGWAVWDGAVALGKYLKLAAADLKPRLRPGTVLELGSGTGLAGLCCAAALRLPTLLTDLPEVLPALQRSVDKNPTLAPLITTAPLDWTGPDRAAAVARLGAPCGLVIVADCVWVQALVAPLVATLEAVTGPSARVLVAHQSRSSRVDVLMWQLLERRFEVEEAAALPGEGDRGRLQLFWLAPKATAAAAAEHPDPS